MQQGDRFRTAVVTGASKGIGRAIALYLAQQRWNVWAIARGERDLEELSEIEGIYTAVADVSDAFAVQTLYGKIKQQNHTIDALINNAALQGGAPISEQSLEDWQGFLNVNVTGPWLMTKYALDLFSERASVVNVGSVASVAGFAERAGYCASKHALLGLTKSLAAELAPKGIRVNLMVLGSFETPGLREMAKTKPQGLKTFENRQLLGRLGELEEAAKACEFLASDASSFTTGSTMTVDGGLLTKGNFG